MSSVKRRPRSETRQRPTAGPWRLRLRWLWSRLSRPFLGMFDPAAATGGSRASTSPRAGVAAGRWCALSGCCPMPVRCC